MTSCLPAVCRVWDGRGARRSLGRSPGGPFSSICLVGHDSSPDREQTRARGAHDGGEIQSANEPVVSPEVRRSLAMLTRKERRIFWVAVGLQMATSLLDLAGVLLFGMVGVIAASAAQGLEIPNSIQTVLSWFGAATSPRPRPALSSRGSRPCCWSSRPSPPCGSFVGSRSSSPRRQRESLPECARISMHCRSSTSTDSKANGQRSPSCTA